MVLDFYPLEGTHSGENLATVFFNIIKEYGISNKVNFIYILLFYLYFIILFIYILLFYYIFIYLFI
jgi:hypothetical protein